LSDDRNRLAIPSRYSLFGIFNVHIPAVYGEGKQKALKRLHDKIDEDYLCLAKLWSADPRDLSEMWRSVRQWISPVLMTTRRSNVQPDARSGCYPASGVFDRQEVLHRVNGFLSTSTRLAILV